MFKIAHMYYDLLELYGDRGNIIAIEYILKKNNIEYQVDKITVTDTEVDISTYDLVFIGGGSDKNQLIVEKDLLNRKDQLLNVMQLQGFILTICGGYQMFGEYYLDAHNNKIEGLGIFDYYTKANDKRCVGNIKILSNIEVNDEKFEVVGFENHSGVTLNVDKEHAFGRVLEGNGNEYESEYEGYLDSNFIGTYIHGALLPKNPKIIKYIIEKVFKKKYRKEINIELDFEKVIQKAKEDIIY